MARHCFLLALVLVLASPLPLAAQDWLVDPARARAAMSETGKPGLFYFYNLRALPCQEMQEQTFSEAAVQDLMGGFVCAAVHQPNHMELFKDELKLFKVPTVVFLSPDGEVLDKAIGMKGPVEFRAYLERILGVQGLDASESRAALEGAAVDVTTAREGSTPVSLSLVAPRASSVMLVGDFNDWRLDETPLTRDQLGRWTITAHLGRGAHEYLFLVDGEYARDPLNPLSKVSPMGTINSVVLVGNPVTSPIVSGPNVTFILYNAEATSIAVAGTFNNWQPFTMYRNPDAPGMWGVVYEGLPPGAYEYKYIIDGEWSNDPHNFLARFDRDGNTNNTFIVGEAPRR